MRTMVHQASELVHVRTATEAITATPNHPFWVRGRGWVDAGDLASGDTLVLADGGRADIVSVTREKLTSPVDVYNLEVEDYHTYFVASSGVWVHNCGGVEPGTAIGKVADLDAAESAGESFQRLNLPDQGSVRANWGQNSSVLRAEMARGLPIWDKSFNAATGELTSNTGFLAAERALLVSHGWSYDPVWTQWTPGD